MVLVLKCESKSFSVDTERRSGKKWSHLASCRREEVRGEDRYMQIFHNAIRFLALLSLAPGKHIAHGHLGLQILHPQLLLDGR